MSHHNSRRLAGSALLGVPWRCSATSMLASLDVHRSRRCSAFLGVARRHRCLQVSTFTDLSVARRIRSVGSHNVQQQLAQVAEPWGGPLHPTTIDTVKLTDEILAYLNSLLKIRIGQ